MAMTRREMKQMVAEMTREELANIVEQMKADGEYRTVEQLVELGSGFLSPTEMMGFMVQNQCSGHISNGGTPVSLEGGRINSRRTYSRRTYMALNDDGSVNPRDTISVVRQKTVFAIK